MNGGLNLRVMKLRSSTYARFEFAQLPFFEIPKPLNLFSLPTDILKVMFHLLVGGITAFIV